MNDVPLVKDNKINDINTSIIAIKKQLKQLNEAVGLIDIPDAPDLSPYVKKSDIVDAVTSGDMHPVTSNAVAQSLNNLKDSYEPTRYSATPNTSYVDTLSTVDGVSVYKTKNGWKLLTGYFVTTNAVASGVILFTLPSEVIQTRPAQLWVPAVSVYTGLTYLLLFGYNMLITWGGINPPANDTLFIPPVTYL